MNKLGISLCLFFSICINTCFSQLECNPGKNIIIKMNNFVVPDTSTTTCDLYFLINNSNPSVFFVDSVKVNNILTCSIQRKHDDIICSLEYIYSVDYSTIDLYIYGTGLAGNDTITNLFFTNILYNNNLAKDTLISIICKNNIFNHNYAKFAKIFSVYPNPMYSSSELIIEYLVDIPSEVKFTIVDEQGKEVYNSQYYKSKIGKDKLIINSSLVQNFCIGKYWIFLRTSSGIHYHQFILIK